LEGRGVDRRIILKCILKKQNGRAWRTFLWPTIGRVYETWLSLKFGKFLIRLVTVSFSVRALLHESVDQLQDVSSVLFTKRFGVTSFMYFMYFCTRTVTLHSKVINCKAKRF
jgi:hypothetical protein